jgi:hypothetical protein
LAEVSNPFLICRTILKIKGLKDSKMYFINDVIFASIFILARVILTPFFTLYMYEAEHVLYTIKLGISLILFVQLIWAYRIIELVFETITTHYTSKGETPPGCASAGLAFFVAIQRNKRVKVGMALFNFLWIFVLPHVYYGYYTKTLHFNLYFTPQN